MNKDIKGVVSEDAQRPPGPVGPGGHASVYLWLTDYLCQRDRSCPLSAGYVAAADQHLDSPIALPASLSSFMAFDPLLAESAGVDLITGDSGRNQRITNGVDPALAQRLVVSVCPARIGVAVDSHPC